MVNLTSCSLAVSTGPAAASAHEFEFGDEVALPVHAAPQWDYSYTGMLALEVSDMHANTHYLACTHMQIHPCTLIHIELDD